MKASKLFLTLLLVLLCVLSMVCPALADAIIYDYMGIWIDGTDVPVYTAYVASTGININMREGPGTDYVVLGTANNYASVHILAEHNGWGYAEFYNPSTGSACSGWVSLSHLLTELPVSETKQLVYAAPGSDLHLRNEPASCYPDLLQGEAIPVGTALKITKICYYERCDHAWGFTSYNGVEGWVCLAETQADDPLATAEPQEPVSSQTPAPDDSLSAVETPSVDTAPDVSQAPSKPVSSAQPSPTAPTSTIGASHSPALLVIILVVLALLLLAAVIIIVLLVTKRKAK